MITAARQRYSRAMIIRYFRTVKMEVIVMGESRTVNLRMPRTTEQMNDRIGRRN